MDGYITHFLLIGLALALFVGNADVRAQQAVPESTAKLRWYKGNTHTHTLNSDGDSSPDDVVKWYREHRYNFLVLTDHEFITDVSGLNSLHGKEGEFLVMQGQEVTDSFDTRPYHVNGLGVQRIVMPQKGTGIVDNVQRNVDAVRNAGGVPQINHPNFGWALLAENLKLIQNVQLFELFNGHPLVNNLGGGGSPGTEQIWDAVLSSGKLIYGIAVDDSHHFKRIGDATAATPGHGWVVVRAAELSSKEILAALERGDFYASTGVDLEQYAVDAIAMTVTIKEQRWSKYRVQFIGSGGRILSESTTNPAIYRFQGSEGYVRAKIIESNGKLAWTQPVLIKSPVKSAP